MFADEKLSSARGEQAKRTVRRGLTIGTFDTPMIITQTANSTNTWKGMTPGPVSNSEAVLDFTDNYLTPRNPNIIKPRQFSTFEKYGRIASTITDSSMNRLEISRAKEIFANRTGIRHVTQGEKFMVGGQIDEF